MKIENANIILKTSNKLEKQLTVNTSNRKLTKNRLITKNEIIQDNICAHLDNVISETKKIEFQSKRRDQQKAYRKAKRLNK